MVKHEGVPVLVSRWAEFRIHQLRIIGSKIGVHVRQLLRVSVSIRLAEELNRRLEAEGRDLDVFVQVNTSGEASKFGLHPDDLIPFVQRLPEYPRLKPHGLMTLAIFSADTERVRQCFRLLHSLRDRAVSIHPDMTQLSMGMSGDFELAIAEGANVVRVGQAIFGPRPTSNAHYWPGLMPDAAGTRGSA